MMKYHFIKHLSLPRLIVLALSAAITVAVMENVPISSEPLKAALTVILAFLIRDLLIP